MKRSTKARNESSGDLHSAEDAIAAPPMLNSMAPLPGNVSPVATLQSMPSSAEFAARRYFHIDFKRVLGESLGISVVIHDSGLRVFELTSGGAIAAWNSRSMLTFPEDALQVNDIILKVNGVSNSIDAMMKELNEASDFFMVVYRDVLQNLEPCCEPEPG